MPDERGASCAAFLERAIRFYREHGIIVERVLTDNAMAYRHSADFHRVLDEHGIGHRLIRPYRPQTNGKVERYNRTLLDEWAYASVFNSSNHRKTALASWLNEYNYDHTTHSLANHPPAASTTSLGTTTRARCLCCSRRPDPGGGVDPVSDHLIVRFWPCLALDPPDRYESRRLRGRPARRTPPQEWMVRV